MSDREIKDSRRLTGPNVLWQHAGAVLDVGLQADQLDTAIEAWTSAVRSLLDAVGWSDQQIIHSIKPGGVSLAISAPLDALYAATELNEAAWNVDLGDFDTCLGTWTERVSFAAAVVIEKLTIEIPEPKEIWPEIPDGGAYHTFDFDAVEDMIEEVVIEVTDGNDPLPMQDVTITADWIVDTGGHDHNNAPAQEELGTFEVINPVPPFATEGDGTILTRSDADGLVRLRYTAPIFGGQVVLRVTSTIDGEDFVARDTLTGNVSIPAIFNALVEVRGN